jgi:hypothetical protein
MKMGLMWHASSIKRASEENDVVIECVRYEDGRRKSHGKENIKDSYTTQS